jgi:hypothetical protein
MGSAITFTIAVAEEEEDEAAAKLGTGIMEGGEFAYSWLQLSSGNVMPYDASILPGCTLPRKRLLGGS